MNNIKYFWITITGCVFFTLALTACFSPYKGDTGYITINLGAGSSNAHSGSARAMPWPPDDPENNILEYIEYKITLTGSKGDLPVITANGGTIINEAVPVGFYNIKVLAFYNEELYAECDGTNTVQVRADVYNSVTVKMYKAFSDDCNDCGDCDVCDTGCGECGDCEICNNCIDHIFDWLINPVPDPGGNYFEEEICLNGCGEKGERRVPVTTPGLQFTQIAGGYSVNKGTADAISIIIPAMHEGQPVIAIAEAGFSYFDTMISILIPDSVTSIGQSAFINCSGLTIIIIPDSVTSIVRYALSHCISLTSITLPNNITSITEGMFQGCTSLTSVIIPDGVTNIGSGAFEYCSELTSITIPASVTSIEGHAFYGCVKLTTLTIQRAAPSITTLGNTASFQDTPYSMRIIVPTGSVLAYKAAENWNIRANQIHAVNCTDMNNPCTSNCN